MTRIRIICKLSYCIIRLVSLQDLDVRPIAVPSSPPVISIAEDVIPAVTSADINTALPNHEKDDKISNFPVTPKKQECFS